VVVPSLIRAIYQPVDYIVPLEDVLSVWNGNEILHGLRILQLLVLFL
jgi:hypothetical protein